MDDIIKKLESEKLLPLYTVTDMELLNSVEEVLLNNNLSFIEVTYRSEYASKAIKYLSDSGKLIVGAGTVRNLETAKEAIQNGAQFIVMPGLNEEVIEYCIEHNILVVPGAVTPTEIMKAQELGIKIVKFFPADVYGGIETIQSLSGPFYDVKFIPTGGINEANYLEYLNVDAISAVGGSFIISEKMFKDSSINPNDHINKLVESIFQ